MPPTTLDVRLAGSKPFAKIDIEGGSTSPAFNVQYLRKGVWHHFVYQASDRTCCKQRYIESLGLTDEDIIASPLMYRKGEIDFDQRPDLNPKFSVNSGIQVAVEYKRGGVTHWFAFNDTLESPRLQSYIESIGLSVFDVKIHVLTVPDEEFNDFLDIAR